MNYIGAKNKLLPFLDENITEVVGSLKGKVFCDIFAGTGAVGRYFKTRVSKIIANDIETYSYVLNKNYIANHQPIDASEFLDELNSLNGIEGFIFENYAQGGKENRLYFSSENAKKIDAIRLKIEEWKNKGQLTDSIYYFLLASLLECADKVANTASVYGAYLKKLKKTALKPLILEPALFQINDNSHEVFQKDSNDLIREIEGDILYMDPPYNARQYGANYHLLNTIAIYDNFAPKGKTGMRSYKRSQYCSKASVSNAFEKLISQAKFKYIFLSYNNEGLMSFDEIKNIMSRYGKYRVASTNYQRFKADSNRENKADKTTEYIHILVK